MPRVTIITPSIEGREELLVEATESVLAQSEEVAHLIWLDTEREGPAVCRNRLLERVQTEWVGFLDDDDLLDSQHVAALMALLDNGSVKPDLAWSRCRTWSAPGVEAARILQTMRPDYRALLRDGSRNFIPVTVIARTEAIREAGCFDPSDRYEDYELWRRMLRAGMTFAYHPFATWTYRFLGENRTWEP
jgi:glycosyltransferase involved in cell wall biosynthesis